MSYVFYTSYILIVISGATVIPYNYVAYMKALFIRWDIRSALWCR